MCMQKCSYKSEKLEDEGNVENAWNPAGKKNSTD